MNGKIRRVVTGHDKNGKAIVIEDGLAPAVRSNPLRPGHISVDLWKTAVTPHILHATEPDPTDGPKQIHPLPGGTVLRISEIAPETEAIRNITPEQSKAVFEAMGNKNTTSANSACSGQRHVTNSRLPVILICWWNSMMTATNHCSISRRCRMTSPRCSAGARLTWPPPESSITRSAAK